MEFSKEFEQLGFNIHEQQVYLEVVKAGKIEPSRLAKLTKVNRTTVYSIGEKLVSMGLISEDIGGPVKYFMSEGPDALLALVRKEEESIKQKKQQITGLVESLRSLAPNKHYSVPKIKVVEEHDLTSYLYKKYPDWSQSGDSRDNTWWGFHDNTFTEHYEKWIDWTWAHGPKGLKVKFLTNEVQIEKSMKVKHAERQVRFWKPGGFDSSLWIIGDYLMMVKTRERPHYMVEINDTVMARNLRGLFRGLWQLV